MTQAAQFRLPNAPFMALRTYAMTMALDVVRSVKSSRTPTLSTRSPPAAPEKMGSLLRAFFRAFPVFFLFAVFAGRRPFAVAMLPDSFISSSDYCSIT